MPLINCPKCGKETVSDSADFCPECGYAIKDYVENHSQETTKAESYCRNCGKKLEMDNSKFCVFCGCPTSEGVFNKIKSEQKRISDPGLTKNITLFMIMILLLLLWVGCVKKYNNSTMNGMAIWIIILGFFMVKPSDDHLDTENFSLLKKIEMIVVSIFLWSPFFFKPDFWVSDILVVLASIFFSGWCFISIKKKTIQSRNTVEKIIMAVATVVVVLNILVLFSIIIGKLIGVM